MPTEKKLTQLVINKVDSEETLKAMEDAGLINGDELYLVEDNGEDELVLDTTLTVEGGIPDSKAVGDRMTSAEGRLDVVEDRVEPMETKLAGIAAGATANTGTITGVSANGTSVATSGVANIPAASTSEYGVTKLSSSTSSTSTTLAATASAVRSAYNRGSEGVTAAATAQSAADTAKSTADSALTTANAALPKAGGTMTGTLTLAADPTSNLEAATKQYVDMRKNVWYGTWNGTDGYTEITSDQDADGYLNYINFTTTTGDYTKTDGAIVFIQFKGAYDSSAKGIRIDGINFVPSETITVEAGETVGFICNGTNLVCIDKKIYSALSSLEETVNGFDHEPIFVATHGVTTLDELNAAYDAGKTIILKVDQVILPLVRKIGNYFDFGGAYGPYHYYCRLSTSGTWSDVTDTYLVKSEGSTMTGELVLHGEPSKALGAVPKQYADKIGRIGFRGSYAVPATNILDIYSLGCYDGKIMTVGDIQGTSDWNKVLITTDGTDWESYAVPNITMLTDCAYGNGVYVATDYNSVLHYSTNLTTWSQVSPTNISSNGADTISFVNGKFWAVAYDNVFSSSNGSTWTSATLPSACSTSCKIIYTGSKYYFTNMTLSSNCTVYSSSDGTTWTASTITSVSGGKIVYGNNTLVINNTNKGKVAYSTDGTNFTAVTLPHSYNNSIAFTGKHFIISSATANKPLLYSKDGINWYTAETNYPAIGWMAMCGHPSGCVLVGGTEDMIAIGDIGAVSEIGLASAANAEEWTFTLEDGSTVTKRVVLA